MPDVTAFIQAVSDEQQRTDACKMAAMLERLTGHEPKLYGSNIIGFGGCDYRYDSARKGDIPRLAFRPHKGQTVLYITDGFDKYAQLMAKLGAHKTGKSCLYIKRLSDIDEVVLEQLCATSLKWMAQKYPEWQRNYGAIVCKQATSGTIIAAATN